MSTIEKAVIQIFEKKNRIIEHVKHQILLFDHQIASKCLIDGFIPPSCLFSSSLSELNKEDLISELLLPHQEASIPYCSLYQHPVLTADNVRLPDIISSKVEALNEGLDQCLAGKADELDPSVTSPPQDCRDGMVSNVCPDHCLSLARIQRSKCRQRALEYRNSAKACKNKESCEINGRACISQNKGSNAASLQPDVVEKFELITCSGIVATYDAEKEESGQCMSKKRSEKKFSSRVTRSRSSFQPSKSQNEPLGTGNNSFVAKQDNVVSYELESRRKERNEVVCSGPVTRSRSSVQPSKCTSGLLGAGKSSSIAKQEGVVLTESISKSRLVHELLESEFFEPVRNTVSCGMKTEERGQCLSKPRGEDIYSGRITRSRSSIQPPKSENSSPGVGKRFSVANHEDIVLTESINKSGIQHDAADQLLHFVKPIGDVVTCIVEKEERGQFQSKERGHSIHSASITRARRSFQSPNTVNGLSCAGKSSNVAKCDENMSTEPICESKEQPSGVDELLESVKPSAISSGSCGSKESNDPQSKEKNVFQGRLKGSRSSSQQPSCANKHLKLDINPDRSTDDGICQSMQVSSHAHLLEELVKPCDITDESCGIKATTSGNQTKMSTVVDKYSDGSNTSRANCSANMFQLADSSNFLESEVKRFKSKASNKSPYTKSSDRSKGIEFKEVSDTQANSLPCAYDSGLAELNQCDAIVADAYADSDELVEAHSSSASSASNFDGVDNNLCAKSLNMYDRVDLEVVSTSPHYESALMVLPKQLDFEDLRERTLNEASSLISEHGEVITSLEKGSPTPLPCADKPDKATSLLYQEKYTSSLEKLEEVKSTISAQKASNPITDACSCPEILANTDFTGVCSPTLRRKASVTSSDVNEHPYAVLFEKTKGHSLNQKMETSPSQNQHSDSIGRCIADDIDSILDHIQANSSENKSEIQSIQPDEHSGSGTIGEGSWPHKRRKIEAEQSNSLSLSLSLKEEDIMLLNGNKSLTNEEDQNVGRCNLKENGGNDNTPSNVMDKQLYAASISSLPQETLEIIEDHSVEGRSAVDPSSTIFSSTRKCTADENKALLNVGHILQLGNIEHFTCDGRCKQESKSQLGGDSQFSTSLIHSPCQPLTDLASADQSRPEVEGLIIQTDSEQACIGVNSFHNFDLPKTTIERAELLEQLCRSSYIHTPLSQFPTTYRLPRPTDLHQSVPTGLLECMDFRDTLPNNDVLRSQLKVSNRCFGEDTNHALYGGSFSDCLPFPSSQDTGNGKKPYLSPIGKFWDKITSNSGSSEKRGSLNPDLPCISEENENTDEEVDTFQEDAAFGVVTSSLKRKPLAEIKEGPSVPEGPEPVSEAEQFSVRDSLESVNTAYGFTGNENEIKQKISRQNASKRRDTSKLKQNQSMLRGKNGIKRASESLRSRFSKPQSSEKTNLQKAGPGFSQKDSKVNNIVSNITSFIPIVQQKQAASTVTGKRDVKVKALEAAEAAKRLAEKKENDRKMKKEALKLERARLERENLRQLELEKKKKEEERKRKEADMAAKKRLREEVERLEEVRKKKHMEEARRNQRAPEEKLCSNKDENEKKCQAPDERAQTMKVPSDEAVKLKKVQKELASRNEGKVSEMEFRTTAVASTSAKACTVVEDNNTKVTSTANRVRESDNLLADPSQEQSYCISPYKDSDEEEEDDEEPNNKFIPSWASKNRVARVVASQQCLDPEVIFPKGGFCSISEALLPRKLQQNRAS